MNLQTILTGAHCVLDRVAGGINLLAPRLLGSENASTRAALAPPLVGAANTAYSSNADDELGAVKLLPMPVHLVLDAAKGAYLASSPWMLGMPIKVRATGCRTWSWAPQRRSLP